MRTTLIGVLGVLGTAWLGGACRDSTSSEQPRPLFAVDTVSVAGQQLYVPPGFTVNLFSAGLDGVRTLALAPDGAVYAALSADGQIVRLVDRDGDGVADDMTTVLSGLNYPFGLAFRGDTLYFAVQSRVRRLDPGQTTPVTIVPSLPTGGHVSRSIAFGPDNRLYVAMGSSCDVCDDAPPRAAVTRYDLDGSNPHTFATGLRNSVGIAFNPTTGELWANNNDRDNLGDDVPPEHLNIVRDGRWYGWPQCYLPGTANPEYAGADCSGVEPPALTFSAHAAPLGLVFYTGTTFPAEYHGDVFMTYHGSWDRSVPIEPRVVRVRVQNGRPTGVEDFVTGFQPAGGSRWGRPVSLLVMPDGALLVSDDASGRIWRVSYVGGAAPAQSGGLEITTATTGTNLPASYTVVLDGGAAQQTMGANATARFNGLVTGDHSVRLDGVPSNCTLSGANPRTMTVNAGAVTGTTFSISCTGNPPPTTGSLDITAATTGSQPDPDDYLSVTDNRIERVLGINQTIRINNMAAGQHTVFLDGVANNCTVSGANPRAVTIAGGVVSATTFSVTCGSDGSGGAGGSDPPPPSTGDLDVTAVTTGSHLDSDDYLSVLDGSRETVVGINATVRITGLAVGSHTVMLDGVASNCTVTAPNPRSVTISAGAATATTFSVRCL